MTVSSTTCDDLAQTPLQRGLALLACVLVCLGVASLAGVWSAQGVNGADGWYAALEKPAFQPPDAVFGPVWSVLYVLMALVAWRITGLAPMARRPLLVLFAIQLLLNGVWSWLFFSRHLVAWALVDILTLTLILWSLTVGLFRIDRLSGWLLLPYALWVTYASGLNGAIWILNGG